VAAAPNAERDGRAGKIDGAAPGAALAKARSGGKILTHFDFSCLMSLADVS